MFATAGAVRALEASAVISLGYAAGYGTYTIKYADGTTKEFFQIGLSANKTGLSVYILGLEDMTYWANTFGQTIGKATVTGYCIRFKSINDIELGVLQAAIRYGVEAQNRK